MWLKNFLLLFVTVVLLFPWGCREKSTNPDMMVRREINDGWTFRQALTSGASGHNRVGEWLPAKVPGTVHTDLMDNRVIDDPYYRLNEHDVQWIDKVNWEYRTTFIADSDVLIYDRIQLFFKGIDTYADVFLNGKQILQADNMFREWRCDVKDFLNEGENELRLVLRSPINEGIKKYDAQDFVIPVSDNDLAEIGQVEGAKKVSGYTRKAGYHFGWDWGPRLVTSGIWRPVFLDAWDDARINDLQFVQQSVSAEKATFTAVFEVEAAKRSGTILSVFHEGALLASKEVTLREGTEQYEVNFEIQNPQLWWTNGLGEPYLYHLTGELKTGQRTASKETRIGIRTLELIREQDDHGTSFYFKLNGHPVFMKGANIIPGDVFLPRVTEENYRTMVETAKKSNMNMLRVWGGGIYEEDIFYDLCDENGILVWQDFMFACAMFPGDEAFLENVRQEAVDNVKRLRNHPAIALWCGNNEILAAWYSWGWKEKEEARNRENADKIWQAYVNIFHKILPEVVGESDPGRSYWGSSPSSGLGVPADLINGDEHYWGVWWGKEPFETYASHLARFMSEYGFQSFPELSTVKKYAGPEDFDIFSDVMKSHQRSSIGNGTIEYYLLKEYKRPKDFPSFLYVNHVLQAEGIKFGLEGHRRAMPYTMGSLYWQLNDCWPVASWSSTDYYQKWKALQYYVKKGFEQVLVSPYVDDMKFKVGIVNDRLEQVNGQLLLKLTDFDGRVIWETASLVEIPANSSRDYFNENKNEFLDRKDTRNLLFSARLIENGRTISRNIFFFRPFKELNIPEPTIEHTIKRTDTGYELELKTDKLAKNVYLQIGDEEGFFSDNYFDMLPGEKVTITLESGLPEEKLQGVLTIRTLDDAF
jgi:beta-mannosidase